MVNYHRAYTFGTARRFSINSSFLILNLNKAMKKTYMTPGIVVVRLQHQSIICLSMKDVDGMGYGGASSNNTSNNAGYNSNEARTRESSGVWDEEW